MNDSMAQSGRAIAQLELPGWKTAASWLGAVLISIIFLVSGLWKITDAPSAAVRMAQARIPEFLSLPTAISFGIAETFAGVLILVPRFRRWGAWLASLMLVAFVVYIGIEYNALRGAECNCFPWIKRAVGPVFFISDALMLALAVMAGIWAEPVKGSKRTAAVIFAAVSVFALVSYGAAATRHTGTHAPASITVDGKPTPISHGKVFLYFFDPECLHCFDAAKRMASYDWNGTRVIVLPVGQAQFAPGFLHDTGLKAEISSDTAGLRSLFPFVSVPAGVALENGRQKAALTKFEGEQPGAELKELGFIR
jgi:uncharacterized membrane protein YphA (DoxX/SURF4 family)